MFSKSPPIALFIPAEILASPLFRELPSCAAVALEQLAAIHNERPDELRRMAQEMVREGMAMLARTSHPAKPNLEKIA
jgi:hypothetical protein